MLYFSHSIRVKFNVITKKTMNIFLWDLYYPFDLKLSYFINSYWVSGLSTYPQLSFLSWSHSLTNLDTWLPFPLRSPKAFNPESSITWYAWISEDSPSLLAESIWNSLPSEFLAASVTGGQGLLLWCLAWLISSGLRLGWHPMPLCNMVLVHTCVSSCPASSFPHPQ